MVRFWLVVLVYVLFAAVLFAAEGDVYTFELQWQENGESSGFSQAFDDNLSFSKEPPVDQHEVFRGLLDYHGQTDESPKVGYLWDKTDGKLYVDLNKDGNLTNDPNGILENQRNGYPDFQEFSVFPVSFSTENGVFRYLISANMQGYEYFQQATFRIQSGYAGRVELHDQPWRFSVNDNLQGAIQPGCNLSVYPETEALRNQIDSLPATKQLFLDDHCYTMEFEFKKGANEQPALWCTLTEMDVPTAMLQIEGQGVSRLVFGNGDILVLPHLADQEVVVPVGDFTCRSLSLHIGQYPTVSPRVLGDIVVQISPEQENVLRVGTPLNQTVQVQRVGKTLRFTYEIVGTGGEKYDIQQLTNYDSNKKPYVAIYKGNVQVGSGQFEFG